ncbi:hypothetical protein OE88DRAFT_1740021 [Heliocybe sulcata]|uniref:CigA protein n=1 Tax=Heliocybe sulcata TaxID=5364 RepID=A0A5C3MKB9_9AGAM|nr:hypothetical protein OE88DRAFT_1740021 [Heliocybe sulcata]
MHSVRASAASPSISLEKGSYRLRAPPQISTGSRSRLRSNHVRALSGPNHLGDHETQVAVIIVLLALATVSSFGAAYYLYTTRWANVANHYGDTLSDDSSEVDMLDLWTPPALDFLGTGTEDRFLSYLPHSGFHNQRIAFENALVLSRMLNRSLIIPPVRLGNSPLRYMNFTKLERQLALSGKEGLHHCALSSQYQYQPVECYDYFDYTLVSWRSFMDLTVLRTAHSLVERWDSSQSWLQELNITQDETYTLEDSSAYHFRFVDSRAELSADQKFQESIQIEDLAQASAKLLQIGTLFGSSRLRLRKPENLALRRNIRRNMTLSNPILLSITDSIGAVMGNVYLAVHIRIGDGVFSERQQQNVRRVWWRLLRDAFGFDDGRILGIEREMTNLSWGSAGLVAPDRSRDLAALKVPHPHLPPLPSSFSLDHSCQQPSSNLPDPRLSIPLFISTDASDPRSHPLLQPFLLLFPCTFFLSNFTSELGCLNDLQNPYDALKLKPFLLPFVDAMVAGKARYMIGTEGSTFSAYVQDVLWRTYHGWEIVQRG